MSSSDRVSSTTSPQLQVVRRGFLLYACGCLLVYSTYGTLLNLQSSINIVDGLGALSASTAYFVAVLFCLTFSPMIIKRFGPKKSLCIAECGHLVYIAANVRPNFYTMIAASVLLGMGDSLFWNSLPLMTSYFAKAYWRFSRQNGNGASKDENYYIATFTGYFFTIFQFNKTLGNLISYLALYVTAKSAHPTDDDVDLHRNVSNLRHNISFMVDDRYRYCGSNDCQDAEVVDNSLRQYHPSDLALSVLMSILFLTCLCAILMHVFLVPDTDDPTASRTFCNSWCRRNRLAGNASGADVNMIPSSSVERNNNIKRDYAKAKKSLKISDSREDFQMEEDEIESVGKRSDGDTDTSDLVSEGTMKNDGNPLIVFEVVHQLANLKQICLVPLIFYSGFHLGFAFSELTRAYSSCVAGVSMVPIHVAVYGVGNVVSSYFVGRFSKRIGCFILIAFWVDIFCYAYDAMWIPDPSTAWSLFPAYFAFGISQGIWTSQTMVMEVLYFPKRPEVACGLWSALFASGVSLQFGWSTSVCLQRKIFIHLCLVGVCALSYEMVRKIKAKEKRRSLQAINAISSI